MFSENSIKKIILFLTCISLFNLRLLKQYFIKDNRNDCDEDEEWNCSEGIKNVNIF